jgi:hypothetical protein
MRRGPDTGPGTTRPTGAGPRSSGSGRRRTAAPGSYFFVLEDLGSPWNLLVSRRGDTNERPTGSSLTLFEDGKALPSPHATHAILSERGNGRYSHWGPEGSHILFSSSDNSNPMTNGRAYEAQYRLHLRGPVTIGVLLFVAVCLILLYWTNIRRFRMRAAAKKASAPAPVAEERKLHPVKAAVFSVLTVIILSLTGIGFVVALDMGWRMIFPSMDKGLAVDMSFFEYRDYVVSAQPSSVTLGKSKHPAEVYYYAIENCALPDGTTARFNSLGFRSPEFIGLAPKQPNEIRIVVTGGSASISHNVAEGCTLDANLQRLLTERYPDKVFKVFNLGGGAWKSFQELIAVQRYIPEIKPDLVIAFDGFNDITHSYNSDVRAPYAGWRMREGYVRFRDWTYGGPLTSFQGIRITHDIPFLLDKLSFNLVPRAGASNRFPEYATGNSMATSFEHPGDRQRIARRTDFDPRNRDAVDWYLRNMKLMEFAAEASGSRILHVLQPMLYYKEPLSAQERERLNTYEEMVNYTIQGYERVSSALQDMTKDSKSARYLDLSAPFQGDQNTYFYDYCHMTPGAYKIVAARIADVVGEMVVSQPK